MAGSGNDALVALAQRVALGDMRAVSRLLSAVENDAEGIEGALDHIYPLTGNAHVIGITGVPGAGKSTLVARMAEALRRAEKKVAILAVDPSSPLTGGAILGDRLRMTTLTADPGVYIRSMATRGAHGGLSHAALDAIDVLDAARYDVVLVETVGVGQDDSDISGAVHSTVLVSVPGLGDTVQSIKAGLLETADVHVVNKADKPEASQVVNDIVSLISLVKARRDTGWEPPVLSTSAQNGTGIVELMAALAKHRGHLGASGEGARRRRALMDLRVRKAAERLFMRRLEQVTGEVELKSLVDSVTERRRSPRAAAAELLKKLGL